MNTWIDVIMILLTLTNLIILGTSRLNACIRIIATQGVALGFFALLVHSFEIDLLVFAIITITVKGVVFPYMLWRTLRQLNVSREEDPFIGYGVSILTGPLALAFALWTSSRLPLPQEMSSTMAVPVAMFTFIVGLFMIVSRKKALTQVIGYIILENGIYAFGIPIAHNQPLLIELGILLDVFVAVFVMGIIVFHISRQFDHIDTDQLSVLRS
jgi:hydrogenase-4 component E